MSVVVMPKKRSTLLLEDVKGRQAQRAAALRELDGDEDEDEEIEEIPLLDEEDEEDLPTISSSYIAPAPTTSSALSRPPVTSSALTPYASNSPSSNRFTSIPTPSSHPTPSPFGNLSSPQLGNLSQDTINVLMQAAGNNPEALAAFLSQQQQGNVAASNAALSTALSQPALTSSGFNLSNSLIPTSSASSFPSYANPVPTPTSQPLDLSLFNPVSTPSLSPSLTSEFAQNNLAISSLTNEASDISSRTAALEAQISHLMDSLPDEARAQVENATPLSEGTGANSGLDGFDWGTVTGPNGELDLDKMLAQFTDSSATNVSTTPNQLSSALPSISTTASANDPVDFSAFLADPSNSFAAPSPPLDPALAALAAPFATTPAATTGFPAQQQQQYEVTSPDFGADLLNGMGSPASTVGSAGPAEDAAGGGAVGKKKPAGGGRKRKSDVLGSPAADEAGPASPAASESGAGTRRSARKRKV